LSANKVVSADPFACSALERHRGPVSAGDNCSGYTIACTLAGATTASGANDASGRTLNSGTTTVTYTITDIDKIRGSFGVGYCNSRWTRRFGGDVQGNVIRAK